MQQQEPPTIGCCDGVPVPDLEPSWVLLGNEGILLLWNFLERLINELFRHLASFGNLAQVHKVAKM